MDYITIDIKVGNYSDIIRGESTENARAIDISDAVVDIETTLLALSKNIIVRLGLDLLRKIKVRTNTGIEERSIYGMAFLDVLDRFGVFEVMEIAEEPPAAIIGQIPLEVFDLLIHPGDKKVVANPYHNNELQLEQRTSFDRFDI
ncbi:MAG: hypothetical protein QG635_754 [Bacteroidota bacterium]|nr:hypothetical protein [Bacteroidota bacterium]